MLSDFVFETGSHFVCQGGLKLAILLPQPRILVPRLQVCTTIPECPEPEALQKAEGQSGQAVSALLMRKAVPAIFIISAHRGPQTRFDPKVCFVWTEQCLRRLKQIS